MNSTSLAKVLDFKDYAFAMFLREKEKHDAIQAKIKARKVAKANAPWWKYWFMAEQCRYETFSLECAEGRMARWSKEINRASYILKLNLTLMEDVYDDSAFWNWANDNGRPQP